MRIADGVKWSALAVAKQMCWGFARSFEELSKMLLAFQNRISERIDGEYNAEHEGAEVLELYPPPDRSKN